MAKGFPRVAAYLAGLPQGVLSYPKHEVKASGYRDALARRPLATVEGLPEPLAQRVTSPVPPSAWIPEAHAMALALAIADDHRLSDAEFLAFVYEHNVELLGSKTYAYLMRADGADAMLKHAHVRWKALHRGVELKVAGIDEKSCSFDLSFPARLYGELLLQAYAQTFRAGLVLSGLEQTVVTLGAFGDTRAAFVARW